MRKTKYLYELKNLDSYPKIEVKDKEWKRPEYLCKYYAINERNVSAAISRKIFVSSPDSLNDLFDTLFLRIDIDKRHIGFFRDLMSGVDFDIDEEEFENSQEYRETLRNTLYAIWNSKIGILSTTDDPHNDIMWAYYTNNEGFLIQFDCNFFSQNFGNPIPISYLEDEEFSDYKNSNPIQQLFIQPFLKKVVWEYEKEYRFLVYPKTEKTFFTTGRFSNEEHTDYQKEIRLQSYPSESIIKIILGFDFFKKLISGKNRVDFGKPEGLLKKTLLDFAVKENIKVELLVMDYRKMKFESVAITLEKLDELEFEMKYARQQTL